MGERLRAYRFALDPTKAQLESLGQHAGAARWALNHALAPETSMRCGAGSCSAMSWCGAVHDLGLNAAKNILAAGRVERPNSCGEMVGLSAPAGSTS